MKIYPIQTGTVQIKTNQRQGRGQGISRQLNMFLDKEWTEPLPIYAWAIDHPEGLSSAPPARYQSRNLIFADATILFMFDY